MLTLRDLVNLKGLGGVIDRTFSEGVNRMFRHAEGADKG